MHHISKCEQRKQETKGNSSESFRRLTSRWPPAKPPRRLHCLPLKKRVDLKDALASTTLASQQTRKKQPHPMSLPGTPSAKLVPVDVLVRARQLPPVRGHPHPHVTVFIFPEFVEVGSARVRGVDELESATTPAPTCQVAFSLFSRRGKVRQTP